MDRLEGKTAVITGGSTGIGFAIAQLMAAEGAHVYLTARRQAQLDAAVDSVGIDASGVQADVSVLGDLDRVYAQISADGRRVDIVVANAGGGGLASLAETTEEFYDSAFDINVRGTYFTVQKALPLLNDGGSVILLSSIGADFGSESFGVYSATKAAIRSFARTWAVELAPRQIRVNAISPGAIRTPALGADSLDPAASAALFSAIARTIPLGRIGESEDVAAAALFLASDESAFITGTNVYVDGGQGSSRSLHPA